MLSLTTYSYAMGILVHAENVARTLDFFHCTQITYALEDLPTFYDMKVGASI